MTDRELVDLADAMHAVPGDVTNRGLDAMAGEGVEAYCSQENPVDDADLEAIAHRTAPGDAGAMETTAPVTEEAEDAAGTAAEAEGDAETVDVTRIAHAEALCVLNDIGELTEKASRCLVM
jgi:hypothetical protein